MANALGTQTSPYLLQHARNPVNWHSSGAMRQCVWRGNRTSPSCCRSATRPATATTTPNNSTYQSPPKTPALPDAIAARKAQGKPVAYICQGTHCSAPIDSLETLEVQLSQHSASDDA